MSISNRHSDTQDVEDVAPGPGFWDVMEMMRRSQEPKLIYVYEKDWLALKAERDEWRHKAVCLQVELDSLRHNDGGACE